MKKQSILITGGSGFIGSHVCVDLLKQNYEIVVIDNFSNSNNKVLKKIENLAGRSFIFEKVDIRNSADLNRVFESHQFISVLHFAGLKAVGESEKYPLEYYENNFVGSLNLLKSMQNYGVKNLIFSSSATIYGNKLDGICFESDAPNPINVYGRTKLYVEQLIKDYANCDPEFRFGILRYFNPVGAHPSGLIGENPNGTPNNLFPYVSQVAVGKLPKLVIWGNDYDTLDGTGRRDYIHVQDLSQGHIAALNSLAQGKNSFTVNLGTGISYSVLDVIAAFREASGRDIPYEFGPRRPGDSAECYADASLAKNILNWTAKNNLNQICEDAWRWQSNNPHGYL